MNTQNLSISSVVLTIGALALVGGTGTPVRAQVVGMTARPISLNMVNVPVQAALRTLFGSAGIHNYSIKPDVQGFANISVSDVPFSIALRQLLQSVNPPVTYTVINGVYVVSVQQPSEAAQPHIMQPTMFEGDTTYRTDPTNKPMRFYTIPVNSYDAFVIAKLLGNTGKIIQVPVNIVVPSTSSSGNAGFGGSLTAPVTTVGNGNFQGGTHNLLH